MDIKLVQFLVFIVFLLCVKSENTDFCYEKELCESNKDCKEKGEECHPVDDKDSNLKFCIYGSRTFDCPNFSGQGCVRIPLIGEYRECSKGPPKGCLPSEKPTNSYKDCCSGLMFIERDDEDGTCVGKCYQNFNNMCKGLGKPCNQDYDCPGNEMCKNRKCSKLITGKDCSECDHTPVKSKCCYTGAIIKDNKCYCGNKSTKCKQDNECQGNNPVCCRKTGHCSNWKNSWAETCG